MEHKLAERVNQAAALGDADKGVRRQRALGRRGQRISASTPSMVRVPALTIG
ncbi:Uncharacterised protein [Raoultella terrigena]|uniref:Uncharacterized protein n=1 Tax=Raoultella terrigena TaxID=577 RepID=A0A4U9CX56_RAOTE|nr:Uncharacterised protein [Raoultella terrigena]